MKHSLLSLLLLFSLQVAAQKQKIAEFAFGTPTSLTPPVQPGTDIGSSVDIMDKTFTNGNIAVSFAYGSQQWGAQIYTSETAGKKDYYLRVLNTTSMTIAGTDGATIDAIQFSSNSTMGTLSPGYDQPGNINASGSRWEKNEGESVGSIVFSAPGGGNKIKTMTVYYTVPSNVLAATANDIDGQAVTQFSGCHLTFADAMTVKGNPEIYVANADGTQRHSLTATADGQTVTLACATPITTPGTYTLVVPAHSFANADGYDNKELRYTFTVTSFSAVTITPACGEVTTMPNPFTVTFSNAIGHIADGTLTMFKDGQPWRPVQMAMTGTGSNVVRFNIENLEDGYAEPGTYTLSIPAGKICDALYDTEYANYNPTFSVSYTIASTPTPGPDPTPDDSQAMKDAKALLQKVGVGYPSASSAARTALVALTKAATATDDKLAQAMDAFYAETDVTLPTTDKYYRIESVSSTGNRLYLAYADGRVSLTANEAEASAFKATANADNTTTFQTTDGKFLHALVAQGNYDLTSSANVTDAYNAEVNNLTLAKIQSADAETKAQFGLLTVYGYLGKDDVEQQPAHAYVLVSHATATVRTNPAYTAIHFMDNMSNAFAVTEVSKPDEAEAPVDVDHTITPDFVGGASSISLTLTFTDNEKDIVLTDKAKATIAKGTAPVAEATIVKVADNVFAINATGLADGQYTLTIDEGSFAFNNGTNNIRVKTMSKVFDVENFKTNYTSYFLPKGNSNENTCADADINGLIIAVYADATYTGMVPDETKQVTFRRWYDQKVVTTGHFEKASYTSPDGSAVYAMKFVPDTPVAYGSLSADTYEFVCEAATYGDANFGRYLDGDATVRPAQCTVNPATTIFCYVNNSTATGIDSITTGDNAPKTIFTLQGVRVKDMSQPGIYIVNGKKVIVK